MKIKNFILKIIRTLEKTFPSVICYAYKNGNADMSYTWWDICISDYDVYRDARFINLTRVWRKMAKNGGEIIVFSYCVPFEKKLAELAKNDNLILNV